VPTSLQSLCALDYVTVALVVHQVVAIGSQASTQIDAALVLCHVGDEIECVPVRLVPAGHVLVHGLRHGRCVGASAGRRWANQGGRGRVLDQ